MTLPLMIDIDALNFETTVSPSKYYAVGYEGVTVIHSDRDRFRNCELLTKPQNITVTHFSKSHPDFVMGKNTNNEVVILTNHILFEILTFQRQAIVVSDYRNTVDGHVFIGLLHEQIKKDIENILHLKHSINHSAIGSFPSFHIGYVTNANKQQYSLLLCLNFNTSVFSERVFWKIADLSEQQIINSHTGTCNVTIPNMDTYNALSLLSMFLK